MSDKEEFLRFNPRENYLLTMLNWVIKEYKELLEATRRKKPFKIVDILHLSSIPGETIFTVQITHKNCIAKLSAGEIINGQYNLENFSDFHSEMIKKAAQGKLFEFLKLTEKDFAYKIASKRFDAAMQQYIFTIERSDNLCFNLTADEIARNKDIFPSIHIQDIYEIAYTQGIESMLKETVALKAAKK